MAQYDLDAYLVPRADEWLGEFVAPYAERLKWISGFTGSAGMAIIMAEDAVLLTDSRYTIQARQQLDEKVFAIEDVAELGLGRCLAKYLKVGALIGFDPKLHTDEQCAKIVEEGLELAALPENLIDTLWHDQPSKPATKIYNFPDDIAGDTHTEKCNQIAWMLQEIGVRWYILTQPDSIAWLLNIRASDIEYIPQALSYLMISNQGEVIWFVDPARLSDDVVDKLKPKVNYVLPENMEEMLTTLREAETNISFAMDFKRSPIWFKLHFAELGKELIDIKDPCLFPKSLKTFSEQEAIRNAHVIDGVAVVRFLKWFEEEAEKGALTEIAASDKLEEFRSLSDRYCGQSFPTISGYGANGAIVHYRAVDETNAAITGDNMLLIDSGGQYHYGTTDITRTIAVGNPPQVMKENFTRVLKGHIAVAMAEFEDGTTGAAIDALARKPLQDVGLNYGHGTGHGVGCFLAVHEHAANLSPRGKDPVKPGMLISNEPGYYEEGAYGIRLENLVLCVPAVEDMSDLLQNGARGEDSGLYKFESVTLAPFDRRLIVAEMLSNEERSWLNDYHALVLEKLSPYLDGEELFWLQERVEPL